MSTIIDRRQNPKDKSIRNRQKFIHRSKDQIKEAVKGNIDSGHIADIEKGKVKVKIKGISEPVFRNDSTKGNKKYVLPGNQKHIVGDRQNKSPRGDGASNGKEGGSGTGEDDFEFELNQDEFLDFIFEDLELPDLVKKQIKDVNKVKPKRSGFTNQGNPSQLDVVRSLRNSLGRRIGLRRPTDDQIKELEIKIEELKTIIQKDENNLITYSSQILLLRFKSELEELKNRRSAIPWLDPFDVRYRNFNMVPQPSTQAVMFCIMDVSGSMGKTEKDLSKRFFFFLHMFLRRKYEKVDIIFVRHHEEAKEVDEDTFFNDRENGGTVVSTALELTNSIIKDRYNPNDWNIYVAQASDGDNSYSDETKTEIAAAELLKVVQYFAYVEVRPILDYMGLPLYRQSSIWTSYDKLSADFKHLNIKLVTTGADVWKVFKDLFSKE